MTETKKCPHCGRDIQAVARKCRYCGSWLNETTTASVKTNSPSSVNKKYLIIGGAVVVIIAVVVAIFMMSQSTSDKESSYVDDESVELIEEVSLTPQSLISLNSMSKEEAVHKLNKEGWQRKGIKYNNKTYYKYWNPSITPDETYIEMDKPSDDEVFSFYSESEDVFNQWNDSLKGMGYKKVAEETKFGNMYSTWEKDSEIFVFEMSSIPTFTDETATTINGMIFELKTRKSD